MTITLSSGLDDLNFLVGTDFPEADEDALWRCARAWADTAVRLRQLRPGATATGTDVLGALGGDAGQAFADEWHRLVADGDGFVDQLAGVCDRLAEACDQAATEVEYAKIAYIGALILLGLTIASLLSAVWAFGVSAAGIPVAVAAAQISIRTVLVRLLTAVAFGAAMNVVVDGSAQLTQLIAGHRDQWDAAKTVRAAEDGAVAGVVGGGVLLAAGRLAPVTLRSPVSAAVTAGIGGAAGGVLAPMLHGEMPTAHELAMAVTSGIVGGAGPDLWHGRTSARELAGPHPMDPGTISVDGSRAALVVEPLPTGSGRVRGLESLDLGSVQPDLSAQPHDYPVALGHLLGNGHPLEDGHPPGNGHSLATGQPLEDGHPPSTGHSPVAGHLGVRADADPNSVAGTHSSHPSAHPAEPPADHSVDGQPDSVDGVWHGLAPAPVTAEQAIGLVRQHVFETNAGLGFFETGDETRLFAMAVHATDGYLTLDLHGSPDGFHIGQHLIAPEDFALALGRLRADGVLQLPDGAGIKLLSCDTAFGGENSPAARLARAMGVEVIAPDQPVWTGLDGREIVASPTLIGGLWVPTQPADGSWHAFGPSGEEVLLDFDPGRHDPAYTDVNPADKRWSDAAPRAPDRRPP